jgi:endonuclease/exonuclease/phosphatase (EEP) superfamily protein YafD
MNRRLSKMLTRLLSAVLPAVVAGTLGLQPAHADIYTWIDATGGVSASNLDPPDGVRVINVIHGSAPNSQVRDEVVRDAARDAELQTLTERVRQIEDEIEAARRQVPAPKIETRDDAALDAEVRAWTRRIRQIENEVELAKRDASAKRE